MLDTRHFDHRDPRHWRDRAEEARILPYDMKDERARMTLLKIAENYDKLAIRAAMRLPDPTKVN